MNELLHIFGFCGDHFSHFDLMDLMLIAYTSPGYVAQTIYGVLNFAKNIFRA